MRRLPATDALDRYFLEARSKLLDLAGFLDRIDRGGGMPQDPRVQRIHEALAILDDKKAGRAERVQVLFSLAYEAGWEVPNGGRR